MPDNTERVARAKETLQLAQELESRDQAMFRANRQDLIDLLANLHHLAEDYEFDIDDLWRIAKDHYQAESARKRTNA